MIKGAGHVAVTMYVADGTNYERWAMAVMV